MTSPRSILVIKPSSFGDVVQTLPAVARLKIAWPKARIAWLINPEWTPLVDGNGFVDETIAFPRSKFRGWGGIYRFARWCRLNIAKRRPELVIDFQGLFRSAWIGRASHPKCLVGMADAREGSRWMYDQVVNLPRGTPHAVERYLTVTASVFRQYDADPIPLDKVIPFPLLPPGKCLADQHRQPPSDYILLHPFSRGRGKSLSVEQVRRLCRKLLPRRVIVVGKSTTGWTESLPENSVNLLDQTSLDELIWLVRNAAVVVTVDSGPSHLAAALARPVIAIHTWSDPRRVGPYREDAWVWKNGRLIQVRKLREIEESFFIDRASDPGNIDLAAIAELAISL